MFLDIFFISIYNLEQFLCIYFVILCIYINIFLLKGPFYNYIGSKMSVTPVLNSFLYNINKICLGIVKMLQNFRLKRHFSKN